MDTLRNDDDREINHHGKTITINEDGEDNDDNGKKIIKVIDTNKKLIHILINIIGEACKSCVC